MDQQGTDWQIREIPYGQQYLISSSLFTEKSLRVSEPARQNRIQSRKPLDDAHLGLSHACNCGVRLTMTRS